MSQNERPAMTDEAVWTLMTERCNAAELAAWFQVQESVAIAAMSHAAWAYARPEKRSVLHLPTAA